MHRPARVFDDVAVPHPDRPARNRGDVGVVRDHDHSRAEVMHLLDQLEDALACLFIEVAGGLVGEDESRPVGKRACDRHTLLLAARETGRPEGDAILEPHLLQEAPAAIATLRGRQAAERHRQPDVVEGAQRWDQVEALEDGAHVLQAVIGELAVAHAADLATAGDDLAFGRAIEPADQGQQRRLAAA